MVRILIAGDFAPRARITQLIEEERYSDFLSDVRQYTSKADYSIVNLEAPIVYSTDAKKIDKYGPHLRCDYRTIHAVKYSGFDMVTLANNHFYDYGIVGVKNTLDVCRKERIDVVGGGINIMEASKTVYKEIKGIKIAFINCCEHEFSVATEVTGGTNPIDPIRQYNAISEARKIADKVIMITHGGHEHFQLPSLRMKQLYHFFIDAGADAVINHHQHCFSGYEVYKEKPIFYGLGNFCFDIIPTRVDSIWNKGYMVELLIDDKIDFSIYPYTQCDELPKVQILPSASFKDQLDELNSVISSDIMLKEAMDKYYSSTSRDEMSVLEPYQGRISVKLFSMGLLPKFVRGLKILQILNHVECESHRDRIIYALKKGDK